MPKKYKQQTTKSRWIFQKLDLLANVYMTTQMNRSQQPVLTIALQANAFATSIVRQILSTQPAGRIIVTILQPLQIWLNNALKQTNHMLLTALYLNAAIQMYKNKLLILQNIPKVHWFADKNL